MRGILRNWIVAFLVVIGLSVIASWLPDRDLSAETPSPTITSAPSQSTSPTSSPTTSGSPTPTQSDSGESTPTPSPTPSDSPTASPSPSATSESEALRVLQEIPIKGRAPQTGYSRDLFSDGWGYYLGCDWRNRILARDLTSIDFRDSCIVESGTLLDPYSDKEIQFVRGVDTSFMVQIDHVVAVSDAWQKGAQQLTSQQRYAFYNDPLNLLAVSGSLNQQKGDSDAASWLPPNKAFRCQYVARQIAVKARYQLWVTQAEHDAMARILGACPGEPLPKG
jgi:hypothetical protein